MEIIIVIILISALASLIGKGTKRSMQTHSRTVPPMPSRPAPARIPPDDEENDDLETVIRDMKRDSNKAAAFQPDAARDLSKGIEDAITAFRESFGPSNSRIQAPAEGDSVLDAEGCVGGSLGEHIEEGERFLEHASHLRRADAKSAPAKAVQSRRQDAPVRRLDSVNIDEMRRAVVMAEILDKPKALRRRG